MSDSVVKYIQTIARTELLEEKIGKALAQSATGNVVAAAILSAERGEATDTGINTNRSGQGGANSPPLSTNLGNLDGGTVVNTSRDQWLTGTTGQLSSTDKIVDSLQGSNTTVITGGLSTDLSNNAKGGSTDPNGDTGGVTSGGGGGGNGGNPVGGSDAEGVATQGGLDTGITDVVAGANAQGADSDAATELQLREANSKYGEPGVFSAKNIADGLTNIAQLGPNSFGDTPITMLTDSSKLSFPIEQLKGIVGFDPDGIVSPVTGRTRVLLARFDGVYPTPTSADGLNDSQANAWTDPSVAPAYSGFQVGKFWSTTSPEASVAATPEQCANIAITAVHAAFPAPYPTGYGDAYWDADTLTQTSSTTWTYVWYQGGRSDGSPPNTATVTRSNCPVDGSFSAYAGYSGDNCPITAPAYTNWPRTSTAVLAFINAQWQGNPYDSFVPLGYTRAISSVLRMAVGDGSTVLDDRFLDIQPGVNGGLLVSTIDADGTTFLSANYYNWQGVLSQPNISAAAVHYYKPR